MWGEPPAAAPTTVISHEQWSDTQKALKQFFTDLAETLVKGVNVPTEMELRTQMMNGEMPTLPPAEEGQKKKKPISSSSSSSSSSK